MDATASDIKNTIETEELCNKWQVECADRRRRLFESMATDSMAIIVSSPDKRQNAMEFSFQVNKDIWYLSGFPEKRSVIVLLKQDTCKYIIFSEQQDNAKERWDGPIIGQHNAIDVYGADEAYCIDDLARKVSDWMVGIGTIYLSEYLYSKEFILADLIADWQQHSAGRLLQSLDNLLHEMRVIKSSLEIQLMQHAMNISIAAHYSLMKNCCRDISESELEALYYYNCMKRGGRFQAYDPIIASGNAATILHYIKNNRVCHDGELVLVDAGAKFHYYSSDITRVFPVNGRFSSRQADLYNVVLQTNIAIIEMVKPGITFKDMQLQTIRLLTQGLCDLGILHGQVDSLIEQKAYFPFYMHSVNHYLGLDTHDVGKVKDGDAWVALQAGAVITVEPGLYIPEGMPNVDPAWCGMGIRIEDDVLVTEEGHCVMTKDLVKTVADIEQVMN